MFIEEKKTPFRMMSSDDELCADIHKRISGKLTEWILSSRLVQSEDLYDGLLLDVQLESQIAFDKYSRKDNQRLLLDVEKEGEIRRAEERKRLHELRGIGQQLLSQKMRDGIVSKLSNFTYVKNNVLRLNQTYVDLVFEMSSITGSLKRLSQIISADPELSDNLIKLVNNPEFSRSLKRQSQKVTDVSTACGLIGMDGLRFIIPGMYLKSRLRLECSHFPLLGQKIWTYYVTSSNAARHLLLPYSGRNRNELSAMVSGSILCMGMAAVHQQFALSFERAKRELLDELHASKNVVLYHAVLDVEPTANIMTNLFDTSAKKVVENIARQVDWGNKGKTSQAILENILNTNYNRRSKEGLALGQGQTYATWFLLNNAKLVKDNPDIEEKAMRHSRLSMQRANDIKNHNVNKLNLGDYIG
ncbi:MAG: hypothetical protein CBC55_04865 [Gammaproteobacteria bacterium TMED95]|nr:MAG: hypothetical protein CBC55_04865 [Gammaproteobacteria bacterium TMED95]